MNKKKVRYAHSQLAIGRRERACDNKYFLRSVLVNQKRKTKCKIENIFAKCFQRVMLLRRHSSRYTFIFCSIFVFCE